jgi:hypothetical protein
VLLNKYSASVYSLGTKSLYNWVEASRWYVVQAWSGPVPARTAWGQRVAHKRPTMAQVEPKMTKKNVPPCSWVVGGGP